MIPQVDLFSFVFLGRNWRHQKRHFEINWPLVCLSVCSFLCDVFWKKKTCLRLMAHDHFLISIICWSRFTAHCAKVANIRAVGTGGVKGLPPPPILAGQKEVHITFYFRRIWSYLPLQIFRPSYSPDCAKVSNLANYCTRACPAILPLPSTFLPICLAFHNGARNTGLF